jgi:uncharacterized protein
MSIQVVVVYAPSARSVQEVALTLPDGSTVSDAVAASGLSASIAGTLADVPVGIWGRPAALMQPLGDLDRVEIYRPLKVDPKVARRARFTSQGAKKAGLFAKRRAGAKTGY